LFKKPLLVSGFFVIFKQKMTTYDIHKTAALLIPKVGFRQTVAKKEYLDLDSSLIPDLTKSQIFVNSVSEMFLSVEQMSNGLMFDEGFDVDTWLVTTSYLKGDRVSKVINDRTFVWVAKIDNTGNDPETDDGTNWKTSLSDRLEKYRESAALETISGAISSQANEVYATELRASTTAYFESASAVASQLQDRFIGVCIKSTSSALNKVLEINKIGLHITGAAADVNIYVYHSSRLDEAIQTFVIKVADLRLESYKNYDLLDSDGNPVIIDLFNEDYNQGGIFLIGFFESELLANAQSYSFRRSRFTRDVLGFMYSDENFFMNAVEIANDKLNGVQLPTLGEYYDSLTYNDEIPFNLSFKINQSYFPQFEKNIMTLQKTYQYVLAFMILSTMLQNDRINTAADNEQAKIHELLYGDSANENDRGLQFVKMIHFKKLKKDMGSMFDSFEGMYQGAI
jgi:hypothetical protein